MALPARERSAGLGAEVLCSCDDTLLVCAALLLLVSIAEVLIRWQPPLEQVKLLLLAGAHPATPVWSQSSLLCAPLASHLPRQRVSLPFAR